MSSTYYDLRFLREVLEDFLDQDLGYTPVLHEAGEVPYGITTKLETDCLDAINSCHAVINVLGASGGTDSQIHPGTITEGELFSAIETGKHIFVFVDADVHAELTAYKRNRDIPGFTPSADRRVLEILLRLEREAKQVPVFRYRTGRDIRTILRKQFAGLLASMLKTQKPAPKKPPLVPDHHSGRPDPNQVAFHGPEEPGLKFEPFWNNAAGVVHTRDGKQHDFQGFWRIEFVKADPNVYGAECGFSIAFPRAIRISQFSVAVKKFELHGLISLEVSSENQSSLAVLFDGRTETDTLVTKTINVLDSISEPATRLRLIFFGDSSQRMWYEVHAVSWTTALL